MPERGEGRDFASRDGKKKSAPARTRTRETLFLAEQAREGTLKVLPGKEWALHYPAGAEARAEKLQGLLNGKYSAADVARDIKPDALFYKVEDIDAHGLEKVSARVRDLSAQVTYFDYPRFARFVESMRGREIPIEELDRLYRDITKTRTQKRLMDAYGQTGKQQMSSAFRSEAEGAIEKMATLPRQQKVLQALKQDWLCEDQGIVSSMERDQMVAGLSGDERALFGELQSPFREYVQKGDEAAYEKLTSGVREGFPQLKKQSARAEESKEMQELEQQLRPFQDQVGPPGTPEDPAIPPDDADEYHTPPPNPGESKEKTRARPIFEIAPPLAGCYASGRKSYFDVATKTWSKKKKLTPYAASVQGTEGRVTISGALDKGLKSLPIPNGYAVDAGSLKFQGARPEIHRDQNGCFYLDAGASGSFSVDFLPEPSPFVGKPIAEDTSPLYRGTLSQKTETAITRLMGSPLQKAEQARQYMLANHFYPGGGDLQSAQALQYKLRSESTGDNYLQNLDASEYLECYSANTKFITMMRKAGVPARLVVGHRVQRSQDGKSVISQSTGHAWSEIWDGAAWRRFDATPKPKPEDKKEDKDKEQKGQEGAPEADDGGVDGPEPQGEQEGGKPGGKPGKGKPKPGGTPGELGGPPEGMKDASDGEMSQAESALEQAKQQMKRAVEQQKQLEAQLAKAEKFQDLADMEKKIAESELLEEMKQEMQEKLEAKEDVMKEAMKDSLDQMVEDGFLDEQQREKIIKDLEEKALAELDGMQSKIEHENQLYNEYQDIREEVMPLVDQWFKYFAERLPRQTEIEFDEDSLTRQGAFNRRAVMRARNLLFGLVKNPRKINPSIKPRFMASALVDVSGSMGGEKLKNARKLLVFYAELFSRIGEAFGYIRFSVNIFSDSVTEIKGFEHEYDSPRRYTFNDGSSSTVKVRLMERLQTQGDTNMLEGIQKAAADLNKEVEEYPDYASALYFMGDGGDTCGNAENIRRFLQANDAEHGFGEHIYSAILLGNEAQRRELSDIFGDAHTTVAPDFDSLIEQSMDSFDEDIGNYLQDKTV